MREAYGVEQAIRQAMAWFAEELAVSHDAGATLRAASLRLTGVLDGMGFAPASVDALVRDVATELGRAVERLGHDAGYPQP